MDKWLENFARTTFLRSTDTAHDLKTPLNVAVLNLELLRMRIRKVAGDEDEKVMSYAHSIEVELRRMARIFDAFFVLSTPPKGDGDPVPVNLAAICADAAEEAGYELPQSTPKSVLAHESRIRQAFLMFFDGVSKVLAPGGRRAWIDGDEGRFAVAVEGDPAAADFELTRIFKFYYTDAEGNPDLSLAAARLVAETYGGELNATEESDKVAIRLSFPTG
ncbi:MAG: histidine kinase dimerization/phospho-acceptor domain-containing protein [Acidobacteriota bacterium]